MVDEWITLAEASALIGCSRHTVERYVGSGQIRRRYPRARRTPTLDRASVESFAAWWQERGREMEQRRREQRSQRLGPPQDGEVWLDSATAALVLGYSPQYLGRLALAERVPGYREGLGRPSRWWFRRRDIEQLAAARAKRLK